MGLTNSQYNMIMRDYEIQQSANHADMLRRSEEIYSRFPEFSEIDRKIASMSTACARRLLDDETSSVDELRKQIGALSAKKEKLLTGAGYPADYLEPHYRCPGLPGYRIHRLQKMPLLPSGGDRPFIHAVKPARNPENRKLRPFFFRLLFRQHP